MRLYNTSKLKYPKLNYFVVIKRESYPTMHTSFEFSKKMATAYSEVCRPLCHELKIPQTAFDILMFLANNPEYKTAGEIVSIRKIKANLVSVNVNKLAENGFLRRKSVAGDRRKTELFLTDKAQPIVRRGREMQASFAKQLFAGISEENKRQFLNTVEAITDNLDKILHGWS